jgi:predicted nuclease with TOPRIM domain
LRHTCIFISFRAKAFENKSPTGLESKIKDQAAAFEKKDFELQTTEGLLAEAGAKIAKLNTELLSKSESFEQEKQKLNAKFKTEVGKSSNLQKSLTELQNKCLEFSNPCVQRLKQIFNSVGASCEKFSPSAEDLPEAFDISRVKLMTLMKL